MVRDPIEGRADHVTPDAARPTHQLDAGLPVEGTPWDRPVAESHAELVQGPAGAVWVVIQPSGTIGPTLTSNQDSHAYTVHDMFLVLFVGWLVNRLVFRGRWTVQVVAADGAGRARRRRLHRERVPREHAERRALALQRTIEAGQPLPSA